MDQDGEIITAWVPAEGFPGPRWTPEAIGSCFPAYMAPCPPQPRPRSPPPRSSPPPRPPPPRAATFHSSAPAPPEPHRWLQRFSVARPARSPIQAALAASAPPPPPRPSESPRPPPRPDHPDADAGIADADADDHGVEVVRAAKAPRRGARMVTSLHCMAPDCQRKREAEACQWCVVHCEWALCRVHWNRPGRCQFSGCQHQAPQVRPGESRLVCRWKCCRQHCPDPDRCQYHKLPPRPSTNRTRGVRSAAGVYRPKAAARVIGRSADDADGRWRG